MTSKTVIAAFVLASALAPALAAAAPSNGVETKVAVVRTADLNLASPEGRSTLGSRITGVVDRMCGTSSGTVSIKERRVIAGCRAKARSMALELARIRQDQTLAQR